MEGEALTEQETALYDRQIRVWGADAQRRLSKAQVLVCGMKGTVAEFCKNIVLAGVGSVTLVDDSPVTEESLNANFLIPPDEKIYAGRSVSEICCDSLKDFNPMVNVSVEKGEVSSFGTDFYEKFDVVVVSCCSLSTKKVINEKCRKLSKQIPFYSVDCRDSCGEIFADLQVHSCTKKEANKDVECCLQYPSFAEAITVPWKSLPKRVSKLYFAMRVIEKFEEAEGRKPGEISAVDFPSVLKLRNELCEAQAKNLEAEHDANTSNTNEELHDIKAGIHDLKQNLEEQTQLIVDIKGRLDDLSKFMHFCIKWTILIYLFLLYVNQNP